MNHHPKPVLRAIQNTARCMAGSITSPAGESGSPKPRSAATPPTPAAVKKTINDIEKLNKQLRNVKSKNDVLTDQLKSAEDQLKNRDRVIANLKDKLFSLKNELDQTHSRTVPKTDYDRLKSDSEKLKETVAQYKTSEKSLSQENNELNEELKLSGKIIGDLKEKVKSLEAAAQKLPEVESERDCLVTELKRFSDKLIQSEQLRKEERETLTASFERQIALLEELIPYKSSKFDISSPLLTSPPNILSFKNKSAEGESLGVFHEMKCKDLEEQLEKVQREIAEKTLQLQQLSDQLADYDCKLAILNTEKVHLTYDRDQMSLKIKQLEEQLSSKGIELSTVQAKFEKSEKEHTSQINSLTLALSRRETDLKVCQSKLTDASQVIDSLRTSASMTADEINSLKIYLDEERSRNNHLSSLLDLNQKELQDSGRVIVTMKSTNDSLLTEVSELKEKLDQLTPENEGYQKKINQLLAGLSEASERFKSTSQQLEDLRVKFAEAQVEYGLKIRQLEDELEKKERDLKNVTREKEALTANLSELTAKLNSSTSQADELRASSAKLQEVLSQYEGLKVSHEEETSRLQGLIDSLSAAIEGKEAENKTLREEKEKIEQSMAQISSAMDSDTTKAKDEIAELKKCLEDANEKYSRQQDELNAIWDKLIEEQAAASHERIQRESLMEENSQLKSTVDSLSTFKSQVSLLTSEKSVLSSQLEQVRREKQQLEKDIADVRREMDQVKEVNERFTLTRSQSEAEMKKLTQLLKDRANSRSDTVERMEQTIAEIRKSCAESHLKEIQRLNSDLNQFNEMLRKKDQQIKQLSEEWRLAEQSFKMERATKTRLINENVQLERQLANLTMQANSLNTTFVMPKAAVDGKFSHPTSPIPTSSTPASNGSRDRRKLSPRIEINDSSVNGSFKRPLPIAYSSMFVDEEPQQFMNISSICNSTSSESIALRSLSQVKSDLEIEEDPLDRLSILASRNKRQPLHLRTSYPAEFQELIIDEAELKGIRGNDKLNVTAPRGYATSIAIKLKPPASLPRNTSHPAKRPSSAVSEPSSDDVQIKSHNSSASSGIPIDPSSRSVFRRTRSPAPKKNLREIQC